jgi:RNA polymerase sigma factor for flagellar operon FliA
MLDELRAMDWVPRRIRSMERELLLAGSKLSNSLGREPTGLELAGQLGVPPDQAQKMVRECLPTRMLSMAAKESSDGPSRGCGPDVNSLPEKNNHDCSDWDVREELNDRFLSKLSDRERQAVVLHDCQELNFPAVARAMSLCESRVRQIHCAAMDRMRTLARSPRADEPRQCSSRHRSHVAARSFRPVYVCAS